MIGQPFEDKSIINPVQWHMLIEKCISFGISLLITVYGGNLSRFKFHGLLWPLRLIGSGLTVAAVVCLVWLACLMPFDGLAGFTCHGLCKSSSHRIAIIWSWLSLTLWSHLHRAFFGVAKADKYFFLTLHFEAMGWGGSIVQTLDRRQSKSQSTYSKM